MPTQRLLVSRPLRAVSLLFVGTAALFAACAPFVPEIKLNLLTFFFAGLAYCLFLSLLSVGLALAYPGRVFWWWLLSAAVPWLGMIIFWLFLRFDPETFIRILPGAAYGLLALILAWLAVGTVISVLGWIRFFFPPRSRNRAR